MLETDEIYGCFTIKKLSLSLDDIEEYELGGSTDEPIESVFSIGDELARAYVKQEKRTVEEGCKLNTKYCYDSFVVSFTEGVRAELEKQTRALVLVRPAAVGEAYQQFAQGLKRASKTTKIYRGDPDAERKGFQAGCDAIRSGRLGAATGAKLLTT